VEDHGRSRAGGGDLSQARRRSRVSLVRVQHYFETKERLNLFACEYTVELAELGVRELTAASLDPDWEAVTLVSLLEGLVSHFTVGNYSGEEAPAAVYAHLDRLFG